MTCLSLYNTKSQTKETFQPIDPENIRMYVCGPTVYDSPHIGNARPIIVFDILFRLLQQNFGKKNVIYVRNITDIDDKIIKRANELYPDIDINLAIKKLTNDINKELQTEVNFLNCLSPDVQPKATEYIDQMREMINLLIDKGFAYIAKEHVLFSVTKMNQSNLQYGQLSHRCLQDMQAGARVEVEDYKQSEFDFILWKPSLKNEPAWESPKGVTIKGRPGWHIECSAMSYATLLMPFGGGLDNDKAEKNIFDIHGGGIDLIFPHHENEIAQSCCALNTEIMANYWIHNGFVQLEGKKMSKSTGNFLTIHEVLNYSILENINNLPAEINSKWNGLATRFSILQTHYHEPFNWTYDRLCNASKELYRWYKFLRNEKVNINEIKQEDLQNAANILNDDLATPALITYMRKSYKEKEILPLLAAMQLLGLFSSDLLNDNHPIFIQTSVVDENYILEQIKIRQAYIDKQDWHQADLIRQNLLEKKIVLKDYKDPNSGVRKTNWEIKDIS
ncbi:cysteine--tRNA ligase [Bartonella sp. DGB1]|uniref:cysteine--tRNA ligase n=1 Tax=Bartonella sp. DGB1 TaxID=3239807 RepID=UPI00352606F1